MHKNFFLILLAGLLGGLLALPVGQAALVLHAEDELDNYAQAVLSRAEDLSRLAFRVVAHFEKIDTAMCSEQDLREMRYLLLQSSPLSDIARVEDGRVACTAIVGVLPQPIELSGPGSQRPGGIEYWGDARHVIEGRADVQMARFGNIALIATPQIFDVVAKSHLDFGALVVGQSDRFVYHALGHSSGLNPHLQPGQAPRFFTTRRETVECTPGGGLCVVAALANINAFADHRLLWITLLLAGTASGVAAGFAGLQYRQSHSALPQQVRRAIAKGRLRAVYQPLVRVRDQEVVGFEVLSRLNNDQGAPIAPDVFIGIAESDGLIATITRQIIHLALTELAPRLRAQPALYVSINLSASDVTDPTLGPYLDDELAQQGLTAAQVVLEITERSTTDQRQLVQAMQAYKSKGYRFYIDDFGTGYSSLAYLSQLPIAGIKIDRSFTHAIGTSAVGAAIVNRICEISGPLGINIVVEGIETAAQAHHVLALNADVVGQGWLFGKPLPVQQLAPAPAWVDGSNPDPAPARTAPQT